jgi:glycosyltransferase involved in cell wall biosynthesis
VVSSAAQIPKERKPPAASADAAAAPACLRIASFPNVLATNPYQRLLYDELAAHGFELAEDAHLTLGWLVRSRGGADYLHFHWPQPFWRHESGPRRQRGPLSYLKLGLFAARLAAARLLGYRIAWTIHQVYPHEVESERLDRLGAVVLARFANVLVAHDEGTLEAARRDLGRPARRVTVIPHGSYIGVYPEGRGRGDVREELGIPGESFVFLCFGDLRLYKEVARLLTAFSATELPGAVLVVAGTVCAAEQGDAVEAHAAADPRIRPLLSFVPEERVSELFGAADAAVIARGDGGTSGSLILALSMGVPAVAARTVSYEDLLDGGAGGWLFEPGDTASLRAALEEAAGTDAEERRRKGESALRSAERLRWPEIGERTAALLRGDGA